MKTIAKLFAGALLFAITSRALAEVHYVDVNSTNATPPYTNWAAAATKIQDAVDAAVAGDEIVVTNGIYSTGGHGDRSGGGIRVFVNKRLSLHSVNGPQFTTIDGAGFRCASLASGASLCGFTLAHGSDPVYTAGVAGPTGDPRDAVLSNCVIADNHISVPITGDYVPPAYGGGAWGVTLNNCVLANNSIGGDLSGRFRADMRVNGGGAAFCTLNNCMLSGNAASCGYGNVYALGGGAYDCTLNNCTLIGNLVSSLQQGFSASVAGGGESYCTLNNCVNFGNYVQNNCEDCYSPGLLSGNNWYGNALFVDTNGWTNLRLQRNSPCINAGSNSYVTNATDLDGNPRISGGAVDIGAYEYQWPQLTIAPSGLPPSGIILTWPTNNAGYDYAGFTLQSTTNLVPPAVWSTNSSAPVVNAGQNVVTDPISGPQKFFRLSQ